MTDRTGPEPDLDSERRVAQLLQIIRDAEHELQALTGPPAGASGIASRTATDAPAPLDLSGSQLALSRRLQNELRVLFDFIPAMIVFKDTANGIVRANRHMADAIGLTVGEMEGRPSEEVLPHDAAKYFLDDLEVIRSGQPRLGIVETVHDSAGRELWIQTDKVPVFDQGGTVTGIIVMAQDITARRAAESRFRLNEQRYRSLVEATTAIVWETPASGLFEAEQPSWSAFTGQTFEELRGWGWLDAVDPDDQAETARAWSAAVATHSIYEMEHRLRARDRTYHDMQVRAVPILSEDGTVVQWIGLQTEITARKTAERALLASTAEFRVLAEAMPQILWITRPDGWHLHFNQRWMDYTGLTLEESLGHGWMAPFHPDDQPLAAVLWDHATTTGETYEIEYRLRRADHTYRWMLGRALPLRDAAGTIVKWFGTCTDVHDLKLAELEISRTNSALKLEIAERSRAEQEAASANRAKSEFLANMSHEIRTPLNGVIGMTDLVLGTDLTSEQAHYLEMVKSSGESLLTVINDILDFSKIEAGHLAIDILPFDLDAWLVTTLRQLSPRAPLKGLELASEIRPGVPTALLGDPGRLRQIVTNLIGNAVKFTTEGDVVLTIDVEDRTDQQATLRFSVADTGIGVPLDQHEAILRPFIQADGSTTREYGGTGLGLAISANLAALLGGRLWLESEPGCGSTFHFTAACALQAFQPLPSAAVELTVAGLRGLRVLVIDDNAVSRRILDSTLRQWLIEPTLAVSGASGLVQMHQQRAAGTPFPLVLLDAQMPGLDGFAVYDAICRQPGLPTPMILMLTSAGRRGDAARCHALGITAWLMKPIGRSDLLDAILSTLNPSLTIPTRRQVGSGHVPGEGRSPLRILVAEDNKVNQLIASRLLEKRGHRVVVAGNGREALAALERPDDPFDLVLMDLQMPIVDGFKAVRIIRAREQPSGPRLAIIALTAHAMKGDEERCLAAGMDGYISKPIEADQLFAVIDRVISSRPESSSPVHRPEAGVED